MKSLKARTGHRDCGKTVLLKKAKFKLLQQSKTAKKYNLFKILPTHQDTKKYRNQYALVQLIV